MPPPLTNNHSLAERKGWRTSANDPSRTSASRLRLQNWGWDRISAREWPPGTAFVEGSTVRVSDKRHLNPELLQSPQVGLGNTVVGNNFLQSHGGNDHGQTPSA